MDVEKTIEFILASQARAEVRLQQLEEGQVKFQANMLTLTNVLSGVIEIQKTTEANLNRLGEQLESLGAKVDKLAESGQETTEKLNALIRVVDDIIRRDRNGKH